MSFESILQGLVDECRGSIGAVLMGLDGIPIAQVEASEPAAATADLGTVGVEFGRILSEIHKVGDAIGGGAMREISVMLERFTLVFRSIDEEVLLVMALAPDGNHGKARYLMRRQLSALREQL